MLYIYFIQNDLYSIVSDNFKNFSHPLSVILPTEFNSKISYYTNKIIPVQKILENNKFSKVAILSRVYYY